MRIIHADCEISYDGRGHTEIGRGVRVIMMKDDGTVIIHRGTGLKPLNYMTGTIDVDVRIDRDAHDGMIMVRSRRESILIHLIHIINDVLLTGFHDDADMMHSGTEKQQQKWISLHMRELMGMDALFVVREFDTGDGPVDILGYDTRTGKAMIVEVKRRAVRKDAYQVIRYHDAIMYAYDNNDNHGILERSGLPQSAFDHPELVLVSENHSKAVDDECGRHDIRHVVMGTDWRR